MCSKCGRRYRIEYQNTIWRDRETLYCQCGESIYSYNGAVFMQAVLESEPEL